MSRETLEKNVIWALVLVIVLIMESKVRIIGIKLNLLVLFAYFAGLRHGPISGLLFGAALGVLADSVAGGILGPRILSLGTVGYLASFLTGRLFTWTPLLGLFAIAILTGADGLISYASFVVFGFEAVSSEHAATIVLGQAAMNAFVGPCLRPGNEN